MQFLSNTHGCEGWAGEMAQRIRAFDWSTTDLGPMSAWPSSLTSAVQMMLASPMPMVMLWGHAGYMIYNDSYSVFAGGRHPYLLGAPVELGWPEVADFNRNVVDTCLAGGTLSYRNLPLELLRDGRPEEVWMDLYYSPVAGDDQRPAGVLAIVVETTEHMISERLRQELTHNLEQRVAAEVQARSAAEEQLRQSQKLEAIGGLTGGVAHDFNNLLQVVAGNLHLLARHEPDNPQVQRRVSAAIAAVERGAKLTSQLLAFARRQPLSPAVYNPLRIYEGLGELLQRALGETIHIDVQLPQDPWCINVDRNQLENALLNLAINARDAMKGEGVIRITGENIILNPPDCAGKSINPGEYVRLAVADSGAGMSPTILARAFEPFFTTKPNGHGTGLGLSMVFGFVRQSGGHVEVESVEGSGTVVQMYFPRNLGEPENHDAPVELTQPTGGHETILVVEDNEGVRAAAVELLEQSGYTVLTAEDGDRAMLMLQAGLQPDLIFTDVVMPGRVKSTDLAEWARRQVPAIAVLFTSGHTRDILSSNHLLGNDIHLLSKPYGPDDLAQRVRSVLTSRMM
ncbi:MULTISPECIES: ATP-binding protein [unclassified Pseudomonas]|uniref:ATP-binding protein n=1 Tax=unclassified Pseudomonas TaxID=196821 RepID=UPI000C817CFA|nr:MULTISPECIES: ATP-binding protein [unclassified Pseudomonas]AUO22853.1 hybrid sensor histidine kinase/response regulator [Pseudomonas sp. NC02]NWB07159.1 response regulator [Pseudomonas sp. D5002]PMU19117.1 hybrid sensor histidine kinase/response regulator [Pseudomonas sp. GP01-A9]PMU24872.1 hybrid sensor histidine kinase/response regulator [Pseudomonas sp. GP01-A13]PMU34202.1 hybrid sensor histidine kinase/response regulator [Pseudomonas sp. GP01-A8]